VRNVHEKADVVPLLAEVFRELGFEGASLGEITKRTGLGKGSLYHFFPGGKDEMAAAVLAHVDDWFERNIYVPLGRDPPEAAIAGMWSAVSAYFHSGARICLVGGFALDATRDRFAEAISCYFRRWIAALRDALIRGGRNADAAQGFAEEAIAGIQGALVLARATHDTAFFVRALDRLASQIATTPL
jgi:TetR/AcrR family transcriptional repressor of lmrAB and yxaGH operons